MGRTACTEPQGLYKGDLYHFIGVMMIRHSQGLISEGLTYDDVLIVRVNRVGVKVQN